MMPGGAKARRWDMLVELYGDIAVEAERDFWSLFDKEFLKAYESGARALIGRPARPAPRAARYCSGSLSSRRMPAVIRSMPDRWASRLSSRRR